MRAPVERARVGGIAPTRPRAAADDDLCMAAPCCALEAANAARRWSLARPTPPSVGGGPRRARRADVEVGAPDGADLRPPATIDNDRRGAECCGPSARWERRRLRLVGAGGTAVALAAPGDREDAQRGEQQQQQAEAERAQGRDRGNGCDREGGGAAASAVGGQGGGFVG